MTDIAAQILRAPALAVRKSRPRAAAVSTGDQKSATGEPEFGAELLRLSAKGRQSAGAASAILGAIAATAAAKWAGIEAPLIWFGCHAAALGLACFSASRILAAPEGASAACRLRFIFILTETLQGTLWAALIWALGGIDDAGARSFACLLLLLVAYMNATVSANIPLAALGAIAPVIAAVLSFYRPGEAGGALWPLASLACATQFYFLFLARKLRAGSLETLSIQAEKDELIAELEEARANSELARRRAEEANLAKSRFLATVSHELRTPLNAILGFSEVMKGELFGAHAVQSYKEYSADIHASGQHLLMLINEILDLSRIEAGQFNLKEERVALGRIAAECRRLLGLRAKKKQITLEEAIEEGLPQIWADERAVRQMVLNLLSNAVKFTPQGGSIKIKAGWTGAGGQYVAVCDTGPGIPGDEIPAALSPFGRGSLAQKNAEEGSGLGLPIAKGLAELHGGTLTLKSMPGEGTEVAVIFPPARVTGRPSPGRQRLIDLPKPRVQPSFPARTGISASRKALPFVSSKAEWRGSLRRSPGSEGSRQAPAAMAYAQNGNSEVPG